MAHIFCLKQTTSFKSLNKCKAYQGKVVHAVTFFVRESVWKNILK